MSCCNFAPWYACGQKSQVPKCLCHLLQACRRFGPNGFAPQISAYQKYRSKYCQNFSTFKVLSALLLLKLVLAKDLRRSDSTPLNGCPPRSFRSVRGYSWLISEAGSQTLHWMLSRFNPPFPPAVHSLL